MKAICAGNIPLLSLPCVACCWCSLNFVTVWLTLHKSPCTPSDLGADPSVCHRDWALAHWQHTLSSQPAWAPSDVAGSRAETGLVRDFSAHRPGWGRDVSFLSVLWVPLVFQVLLQRGLCQHQASAVVELICWSVQAPCISRTCPSERHLPTTLGSDVPLLTW